MSNGTYLDGSIGSDTRPSRAPGVFGIAADTPPTPAVTGWCPFAQKRVVPHFWSGRSGFKVSAVVLHIAQGSYEGTYATFLNENVSAHFCVAKDGRIAQFVSIDDTAWGNGIVMNPSWTGLIPDQNPNLYTISIEHEGLYTELWTPAMYAANLKLLQWVRDQVRLRYALHDTLIGHYEIDSVDRANCPGPNVEWTRMINDLNVSDVAHQALIAGANKFGVPLNDQTALAKYALKNHLGVPLTDEFRFAVQGVKYIGQVWSLAVVYVKDGDFNNVMTT
jgi:N-acetyl-anhydromuramyl-L-alanine amidase AmpD